MVFSLIFSFQFYSTFLLIAQLLSLITGAAQYSSSTKSSSKSDESALEEAENQMALSPKQSKVQARSKFKWHLIFRCSDIRVCNVQVQSWRKLAFTFQSPIY
jgi:hypothetical protein